MVVWSSGTFCSKNWWMMTLFMNSPKISQLWKLASTYILHMDAEAILKVGSRKTHFFIHLKLGYFNFIELLLFCAFSRNASRLCHPRQRWGWPGWAVGSSSTSGWWTTWRGCWIWCPSFSCLFSHPALTWLLIAYFWLLWQGIRSWTSICAQQSSTLHWALSFLFWPAPLWAAKFFWGLTLKSVSRVDVGRCWRCPWPDTKRPSVVWGRDQGSWQNEGAC